MSENEIQDISNHRKSLLVIINETLLDNLSRYQRGVEISKQMLKLCCENLEDTSVVDSLVVLREVVPRESLRTLELIKGALLQSEIMKTITVTRVQSRNTVEILKNKDVNEDFRKMLSFNQSKDSFSNVNNGVIPALAPEKLNDILNSIQERQSEITQEKVQENEKKSFKEQNFWILRKYPIIDNVVVQENEEEDIKFKQYIQKINQFEEDHNLAITEIFKDKELFLKRTQNKHFHFGRLLDQHDNKIVITVSVILDNTNQVANLLKMSHVKIKSLLLNYTKKRF